MREAGLRVTHGSGRITLDRTEVTLTFNEDFSHGPWLGHVDQSRIDSTITMGVILTHGITNNTRTFEMGFVRPKAQVIVHRIQQTPLGRLQAITGIGQGTGNDDGHRIVQEGLRHFVGDIDRGNVVVSRIAHRKTRFVRELKRMLDIEIAHVERVVFDEASARFHDVTHEDGEHAVRFDKIVFVQLHAQ